MNPRGTLLAALAVALTSSALDAVFDNHGWAPPVLGAIAVVAAAGLLARRLRLPALLQPAVAVVLVGLYVALRDARGTLWLGVLPTPDTLHRLGTVIGQGLVDVDERAAPVPTTPGLVLLAVLGVAAIAVLVDLSAVALRQPALAGLPLLALLAVPSGTLQDGVGWLPFLLAASGWLVLLQADAAGRVSRWGTALRGRGTRTPIEESSLGRVGRRIGVAALGVAVVVPALVPGLDQRLLTGGSGPGLGGSRTTVTYNPITTLAGQLRLPEPRTLLAYRTTDPAPDYLRLTTLDRFEDGSGWSSSELSADRRRDLVSRGIPTPPALRAATTQSVTAAIRVQNLGGPWLPVPAVPSGVDIDGAWLWDRNSETVFSTRTKLESVRQVYRVTAQRVVPDPTALRTDGGRPTEVASLAAPPEVSPYVRDLTARVTRSAATDYDKVAALQAFFRTRSNGFVYSEDTSVPGISGPNALETFLRGRRGFCEQYASAMAAMVRVLGIPARVGVGFTPGSKQADGTYRVTTDDAHAWPEVWFANSGWVRFEPTPRAEQVSVPSYTVPPAPSDEGGGVPEPTAAPTASAAPDPGALGSDGLQVDEGDQSGSAGATTDQSSRTPLALGLGAALLVVLATPAVLAVVRRRRLWREGGPRAAWAHVVEDAVDVGHSWRATESPHTAAERLVAERRLRPDAADALRRLADRVERVRYARPDAAAAVPDAELHADVRAVRAGLLATARRRTRWLARVVPPSALRWAGGVSGRATADVLDRVDGVLGAVGSRVASRLRRSPA